MKVNQKLKQHIGRRNSKHFKNAKHELTIGICHVIQKDSFKKLECIFMLYYSYQNQLFE